MAKLKVYRTPTGFHDAYVAAPSQKAALQAWGSDADLFARGIAEMVTDAEAGKQALAQPGVVVRRLRGSAEEQIAAASDSAPNAKRTSSPARTKPVPRPSRAALDKAEQALEALTAQQEKARDDLAAREAALRRERDRLERDQREQQARLERRRDDAEEAYQRALNS